METKQIEDFILVFLLLCLNMCSTEVIHLTFPPHIFPLKYNWDQILLRVTLREKSLNTDFFLLRIGQKYRPEKTPHLNTFQTVTVRASSGVSFGSFFLFHNEICVFIMMYALNTA